MGDSLPDPGLRDRREQQESRTRGLDRRAVLRGRDDDPAVRALLDPRDAAARPGPHAPGAAVRLDGAGRRAVEVSLEHLGGLGLLACLEEAELAARSPVGAAAAEADGPVEEGV